MTWVLKVISLVDGFLFEESRIKGDLKTSFHKKKPKVLENKNPKISNSVCKEDCQWPRNSNLRIKHDYYLESVLFVKGQPFDDAPQDNNYCTLDKWEYTKVFQYTVMWFIFKNRSYLIGNIHICMFMNTYTHTHIQILCIYLSFLLFKS